MDFSIEGIMGYITEDLLYLIVVLYVIGMFVKQINVIPNKWIPLILLGISLVLVILINGISVDSIIQGILIAGVTVFANQVYQQNIEKEIK